MLDFVVNEWRMRKVGQSLGNHFHKGRFLFLLELLNGVFEFEKRKRFLDLG